MKYMGSKRAMLTNGLGDLISEAVRGTNTFFDLFSGSAAVAVFVAQRFAIPVVAHDLQHYSIALAGSVISRRDKYSFGTSLQAWHRRACEVYKATRVPKLTQPTKKSVLAIRDWCREKAELPVTGAYGGYYFSAEQAVAFDALRATVPTTEPGRTIAIAALVDTASKCAAAPGHTAQPFQPTKTAKRFLFDAWGRDVWLNSADAFRAISKLSAKVPGRASVADANEAAEDLSDGDLAFIDPPYSGVHYSRFYHVLETLAQGSCGEVSGSGRYPEPSKRPRSSYSVSTEASVALTDLLTTVAARGAKAILTFPAHSCSNGLSGDGVKEICQQFFTVREKVVHSRFSTLGGTKVCSEVKSGGRLARQAAKEMILSLVPK